MKKYYFVIPIIFFIADRILKYFAPSINIEGAFVKIALYSNPSGAFSLPIAGTIYNIIAVILLFIFISFFARELNRKNYKKLFAIELIIFGGLSNIADRLLFGYVIDYIQLFNRSFFNLADIILFAGVIIFLIEQTRNKKPV